MYRLIVVVTIIISWSMMDKSTIADTGQNPYTGNRIKIRDLELRPKASGIQMIKKILFTFY
jgi:hypothetical protein